MNKRENKVPPLDKDIFIRWFHLHCFSHIFKILNSKDPSIFYNKERDAIRISSILVVQKD